MTAPLFAYDHPVKTVSFDVPGLPQPKGSKTAIVDSHGHARVIEGTSNTGRKLLKEWQAVCEEVFAYTYRGEPFDEPVEARLHFRMEAIQTDPFRSRHAVKPDIDKLVRAVFDSLTKAKVWKDDSLCCELTTTKYYIQRGERAGVSVVLKGQGGLEAEDRSLLRERFGRSARR